MTSTVRLLVALKGVLERDLPERCAAAGLALPAKYHDAAPGFLAAGGAPEVWITCASEEPGRIAGFGGTNAIQMRSRSVQVGIAAAGPDLRAVEHALYAYADLVVEVMGSEQYAGGEGHGVEWLGTAYSESLAETSLGLFREAQVSFRIGRWAALGED